MAKTGKPWKGRLYQPNIAARVAADRRKKTLAWRGFKSSGLYYADSGSDARPVTYFVVKQHDGTWVAKVVDHAPAVRRKILGRQRTLAKAKALGQKESARRRKRG